MRLCRDVAINSLDSRQLPDRFSYGLEMNTPVIHIYKYVRTHSHTYTHAHIHTHAHVHTHLQPARVWSLKVGLDDCDTEENETYTFVAMRGGEAHVEVGFVLP